MAFDANLVVALTGASKNQLYEWNRTELLVPEVSTDRVEGFLWSFRDVLALRTFMKLRSNHSLQAIRKAMSNLRELNLTEHPASYTLTSDGSSVFLVEGQEATDLLQRKHQQLISKLDDIFRGFPHPNKKGTVVDLGRPRQTLEVDERRLAGFPTIQGTRIPFDIIGNLVYDGEVSFDEVSTYYPGVTPDQARDALSFLKQVEAGEGWVA